MKRVIELVRVSTEGQAADDRAGIPAQRAANRRTAQVHGLEIVRSIEFSDVSGAAVLLAPEIQELLRLIADPLVHGVVAREFSRLMRPENLGDYALLQVFVDTNTLLYLPDGPIDFASKTGRVWGVMRAAWAGLERVETLEKLWGAKEEKRRAGGFSQSAVCLPYGVGFDSEGGWHYTPKAAMVRAAFQMLLRGSSYTDIARLLGVTIPGVRKMLRNPIYTGLRVIDERRDPSPGAKRTKPDGRQGDRRKIKRAPEDVIRKRVISEPLVSDADFARAQEILEVRRRMNARTRTWGERRYTYRGFLLCALCGRLVYTHYRREDYYVCKGRKLGRQCESGYMRRDLLDRGLDRLLSERLSDRGFLEGVASELWRKQSEPSDGARARGVETELARLEGRRGRTLDAFIDGAIAAEERDRRLRALDSEIAAAREVLFNARPRPSFDLETLVAALSPFAEFEFLSRADKRLILEGLRPVFTVHDYRITEASLPAPRGGDFTLAGRDSSPPRA